MGLIQKCDVGPIGGHSKFCGIYYRTSWTIINICCSQLNILMHLFTKHVCHPWALWPDDGRRADLKESCGMAQLLMGSAGKCQCWSSSKLLSIGTHWQSRSASQDTSALIRISQFYHRSQFPSSHNRSSAHLNDRDPFHLSSHSQHFLDKRGACTDLLAKSMASYAMLLNILLLFVVQLKHCMFQFYCLNLGVICLDFGHADMLKNNHTSQLKLALF